jgi:hypothetical protein
MFGSTNLSHIRHSEYLQLTDEIGAIMANPDNIRSNREVRKLWLQYYQKLYNTDIDIITTYCSDEEFRARADAIADYIRAKFGCECTLDKIGAPQSFRWQITTELSQCHPIDFYRNEFGNIFHYHTQMVRAAHSVAGSHMYLSNACCLITGYCFDRR